MPVSASRFIAECDQAKLFAEKHAECMEKAANTDGAERTTWLNRAAYYASTGAAVASTAALAETDPDEQASAVDGMARDAARHLADALFWKSATADACAERDRLQRAGEQAGEEIVGLTTSLRLAALDTDAMCATIERLTAELDIARAERDGARYARDEARTERDINRVALAEACGEIDHLRAALARIAATATVDTVACHLRDMAHTALDY